MIFIQRPSPERIYPVGPDAFSIVPSYYLALQQVSIPNAFASSSSCSVLEKKFLDGAWKGDRTGWHRFGNKKTHAGSSANWHHTESGITMGVLDDSKIIWISGNASRLAFGTRHNGRIVRTQEQWDSVHHALEAHILPIITGEFSKEYHFTSLEFGTVVQQPFSKFKSLLRGRNYPGLRNPASWGNGSSLTFGTGEKPKFQLKFYDKGKELRQRKKLLQEEGVYTRIEFKLRGTKIGEFFGGNLLKDLTVKRMNEMFFPSLYQLDPDDLSHLIDLPPTKAGILAASLLNDTLLRGGEDPSDWYIRVSNSSVRSRQLVKDAQKLAMRYRGETLRDLVPDDGSLPFVDLGS